MLVRQKPLFKGASGREPDSSRRCDFVRRVLAGRRVTLTAADKARLKAHARKDLARQYRG